MKCFMSGMRAAVVVLTVVVGFQAVTSPRVAADEPAVSAAPSPEAVARSRRTVQTLDNIFKQTIVLVTDKYVNDDDDFAAGSAAVLLFKNISNGSDNTIRLIDATGEPYEADNVAKDDFEKMGIKKLKEGAKTVDQVVLRNGKHYLRALTTVPVVMEKCVMCHAHYADAKPGEPIGAISYIVPID